MLKLRGETNLPWLQRSVSKYLGLNNCLCARFDMKALLSRRFAANHQELGKKKKRTSGTQGKTKCDLLAQ